MHWFEKTMSIAGSKKDQVFQQRKEVIAKAHTRRPLQMSKSKVSLFHFRF
jgi:hypothetical protein